MAGGRPFFDKYKGYWMIKVDGNRYPYHRWVWLTEVGDIPEGMLIDHIDGDPHNNDITNLRLATPQQNNANQVIKPMTNIDIRNNGRFRVKIGFNKKEVSCGTYDTLEEAQAVRNNKRQEFFGEFWGRLDG